MNYYENNIKHVRGDTYSSALKVENLGEDLDNVYFTCRNSLNDDSEILFQIMLNDGITYLKYDEETDTRIYSIRIPPEKTKNIQAGTYYYDVQVDVNSDVFTIMRGTFTIYQDCTRTETIPDDPNKWIADYLDEINGEVV